MKEMPLVSIIIPAYNSERTLEQCLRSIRDQTYSNIEGIVVDGGSKDKTEQIAKKYGFNVYVLEGKERSPAINYGIKRSGGEYIYRVDSDVILDKTLVEEAVNKCKNEGCDAVSVLWSPDQTISFWAKVRKLEKDCYKDDFSHSGARFFRRPVIEALGGFNENLVAGEDYDIYNRLTKMKFKVDKINSQELHIGEPKSIRDIIKKQYYYGKTIRLFLKQNKIEGIHQISPIRWALIKNWKKFIAHPILTAGFMFYEIIIYSSSIVGYISAHVTRENDGR